MVCKSCGVENIDEATFCVGCGEALGDAQPDAEAVPIPDTSATASANFGMLGKGLGISAFVLSLLSLVLSGINGFGILCGVTGLIFSNMAAKKTEALGYINQEALDGKKFSIIALCIIGGQLLLSTLMIFAVLAIYLFFIFSSLAMLSVY